MDLKIDSIAYHIISFLIISNNLIRKYKNIWKYLKINLSDIHGASRIIGREGRRKEVRWKGGKTMKTKSGAMRDDILLRLIAQLAASLQPNTQRLPCACALCRSVLFN